MTTSNRIFQLYLELCQKHGEPEKFWPQWCGDDIIEEKGAAGSMMRKV